MTDLPLPGLRLEWLLAFAVLVSAAGVLPATAEEPPAGGPEWGLDFGPYAGHYDFDALTQFEDGFMGGLRLGIHRDSWFRLEAGFDEVYTRREPIRNAARQITLSLHGRVEPQWWRLAPSVFGGLGFVMFDDSDNPDAYSEGYDMGAGLAYRLTPAWRIRADFLARYQQFRVRNPDLPVDDPEAISGPTGTWGRSYRIGAFYDLPTERGGQPASYPVHFGVYAGYWNFASVFRYEDDAVIGLRGGVGLFDWLLLEIELDQITTSNERTNSWSQTVSFAMHGLIEPLKSPRWRPGLLLGVAFMGLDNRLEFDTISEGFDVGPTLRLRTSDRIDLRGDVLFRYQSVRVNGVDDDGSFLPGDEIDYVWSYGLRLGANLAF